MRLLHITDLHYAPNNPFQTALIKALLDDLKIQFAKDPAELIVFSGDLVNNPDEQQIYAEFEKHFLTPVLTTVDLKPTDVVFCPGNHDISFKAVGEWGDERKKMIAALRDPDALAKHLAAAPTKSYVAELSAPFFELVKRHGANWDSSLSHVYNFPDRKASFVALNTAFGCGTEGSEYDRGKLAIFASDALAAFQQVPTGHQVFSLAHHTMSDLNEAAHREILPVISKFSDIHFYGHVHLPRPAQETAPGTSCFMVQGGALYENKNIYNGYAIVDAGPSKEVMVQYRTYYPDRMEFDVGTNASEGGVFYNSPAAEAYWSKANSIPDNDDVCLWLMETAAGIEAELDKTITDRTLTDTFVDPVITLTRKGDSTSSEKLTTTQIIYGKDNLAISSDAEYGATSLLNFLTIQFHRECLSLPLAVVPSLIDGRRIRDSYPALVTSTLRGGLPDSNEPHLKLQPLHDCGRLVVLIDNIDPSNTIHHTFLQAVRKQYPKARLIVAVKMPFLDTQHLTPVLGIEEVVFGQISALTRGKVRALVEKWHLPARYQTDVVVEEIHSRFLALGIPQTACYVVIYLDILQGIDGFNPINSSTVIEQFVEAALQKYKPVYVFRSSFDYRNQIDYLGAIAERMCRENNFVIEYEQLYAWTKQYFDALGLEHDYPKLIQHFVSNKVFSLEANSVYFKYNVFLSFFIAHRMMRSEEFKKWLLDNHRYTNYINEIDIYCGLSRQDVGMIDFFSSEFKKLSTQLEAIVRPLAWTDRLEKLTLPVAKKTHTEEFTENITRQLTSDMPAEERDEVVSSNADQSQKVTPVTKRQEVSGILELWVLTLRALSVSLKNLENLPKAKKEETLTEVLQGWSTLLLYACIVFTEVTEKREIMVGPIKFRIELPDGFDARLLRLLFLSIPIFISDQLRRDLGSQKLSLQLKNDGLAKTLSDSLLQTGLYADLKLPEYLIRLKALKERAKEAGSYLILETLLVKMRDIFLRLGIQQDEQEGFLLIAADISAEIKGLAGEERQKEMDKFTGELRKRDQVNKLRENAR
jgi:predicted phosphodiesterase